MADRLNDALNRAMERRTFLGRAAATALGVIAASFGFATPAVATYTVQCCNLCRPYSQYCFGCACTWSWQCVTSTGRYYKCIECHDSATNCGSNCAGVYCSTVQLERCCAPG